VRPLKRGLLLALAAALVAHAESAQACTAFAVGPGDNIVVGKAYDWHMGQGLLLVNKRGVAKHSLALSPEAAPVSWESQHLSVTFNQYGREFPNGGMNDAGLVLEILWLSATQYSPPDARPALNELQWIQYQLDRFASVSEVLAHLPEVRIAPVYAKVHYFVCDASAACAVIEHLHGKLVVQAGSTLAPKALTNHSYAESVAYLHELAGKKTPSGLGSLERFARTARLLTPTTPDSPEGAALHILNSVGEGSQWNIIYSPNEAKLQWKTQRARVLKSVELLPLQPSCGAPVLMLDLDAPGRGDVTASLQPYSAAANRALVQKSLADLAEAHKNPIAVGGALAAGAVERIASFPDTLSCAAQRPQGAH
jgi:penicillin V acylase-like amidase (Ntn superfamily)